MLVLFQDASDYSKADMTRLILNAFRAIWLPDDEKEKLAARLRRYAVADGIN